jgi:DNA-binding transcriptional ArsR family regulator
MPALCLAATTPDRSAPAHAAAQDRDYDVSPTIESEELVTSKSRQRRAAEGTLVQAVSHPLRVQALSILIERAASPKEIAAELGMPVGNVSYHVAELEEIELIELVEEKQRRGAVEHFYRAVRRPLVSDRDWEKLSLKKREKLSALVIQLILADAIQAVEEGTIDARCDRHLTRVPLTVDEAGWGELVEIQKEALRAILAVQSASAQRLAAAGSAGEGIPASASMLCFEMPPNRRPG